MDIKVQVGQKGTITLPASIRELYNIRPGDTLGIIDLGGIFILTPKTPMVPELAREIERARIEAGISFEEILADLREQREKCFDETYKRE